MKSDDDFWSAYENLSSLQRNLDLNDEDNFRVVVAVSVMTTALLGIAANVVVFLLSIRHIQGDFRHFVANLAVVDIVCGVIFALIGYINVDDERRFSSSLMNHLVLAFYGSFGLMICALTPISISRIIAASQPKTYDVLFSGRRSLVVCLLADCVPISVLAVICYSNEDTARHFFYFYGLLTIVAYLIAFVSNTLVFRIVARHIRVVQSLRDHARLMEHRQVALATLAQAFVPFVCQVPAFLTLSSLLMLSEPITDGNVIVITQLWLASSPLFDALITIGVIKQYRKEAIRFFGGVCSRLWISKTAAPVGFSEEKEPFETKL